MDGTPFGRYRLMELLGRGGMGEVWRAHDTETDRIVAIKLLPAFLSDDEEFQHRFRREAHAAARLNDPHVIPIHNYGEIDGQLYVDMRLIEGRDLQTVLADGPLDPVRAVLIIDQVAKALHAAHEVGLLHRDIKPSNILLDRNDFAYLIDFGIARAIEETRMTKSGNTIGTFQYIAPERLDAGTEDARADIYSLACVLYESLTGHPPFPGSSTAQLINAHLNAPPPRPSTTQPDVPPQVDEVIATGMAKEPDQRYATTIELADAARDAITVPIARPTAAHAQPATEQARTRVTGEPTLAASQKGGAPPHIPGPPDQPPSEAVSNAWWRQRRPLLAAAIVVLLAAAGTTGYLLRPTSPASQTPTAQPAPPSTPTSATPPPPPPVTEAALDRLLLSPAETNTVMGATGMAVVQPWSTLNDVGFKSPATPPECSPLDGAAEDSVYAGSGWTAVRGQTVEDPRPMQHAVDQGVILFPSAQAAAAFVSASSQSWLACANRNYTGNVNNSQWSAGPVSTADGTVRATATQLTPRNGWACQRALTARNNVVIDVTGCSYHLTEQGVAIASQVAAKVPTA